MTAGSGAPTMADVAQRAGVSHQTVSRVLNDAAGRAAGDARSGAARPSPSSATGATRPRGPWSPGAAG